MPLAADRSRPSRPPAPCVLVLAVMVVLLAGCDEEIQTAYGGRTGPAYGPSVNGTAVLADMLAEAGHNVISRSALSPALRDSTEAIVWFPDDFRAPPAEVVGWLEDWLVAESGRTVVYVGRDFDAAPAYWAAVLPGAPALQADEYQERRASADEAFAKERGNVLDGEACRWFTVRALAAPRRPAPLTGPWSAGVDAAQCDLTFYSDYQFEPTDEVLLADPTATIAIGRQFYSSLGFPFGERPSRLIVVANGSFLLNLQLVNHEHRKLASHLIDELPAGCRVVFLESGPGGPPIRQSEPAAQAPNGLELFSIWPLGAVLLHSAAFGLVFCFMRLPIFGPPRDPPESAQSDFGRHVTALGELMHLTGDRDYASTRLEQYRQSVRGEGATAQKTKPAAARRTARQ